MARSRWIKQEPDYGSTAAGSVDIIPCTGSSPAVNEVGKALNANPGKAHARARSSTVLPTPARASKGSGNLKPREDRSAAPSIDTRIHLPSPEEDADEDPADECVLMEVRRRIKVLPEEQEEDPINQHQNQNPSFMSNQAFQAIGEQLKEVNDTLGTLQSLGIQHVASLPELVLVGDQSAGKSSIMSAIAGLNLPHNTGVCTRCPVHIRLSRATGSDWTCRVTLQQDYAFVPGDEPITQKDVTRNNPFPPWVKQPRVVKDFVTIREKVDTIEQVLRWAQVAILNHDDNHEIYIPKDLGASDALAVAEEHTKAKFSPNTVALEIRGPGLPDLSFYDLPGVFANARRVEDQYLADVVLNLTREYISHSGAIILWAVPMNTDPENSTTFRVIRDMNAVRRCLGVMTKADLLPSGGHDQWISILEGKFHKTGLGYFITSRPDKGDLDNQTAWEEAFFNRRAGQSSLSETPIWPYEFATYDDICGVVRLKDFLSRKLAEDFSRSLPAVKEKLQERLHNVVNELKKLPELPDNPEFEIRKGLLEFTNMAKTCLEGQEFLDTWKSKELMFSKTVYDMKPKYIVKPPATNVIDLDADTPAVGNTPNRQPKRPAPADLQSTPSKRRAGTATGTPATGVKREDSPLSTPGGYRWSVAPVATPAGLRPPGMPPRSRSLEELRAIIESKRQPGVPDSIPDAVFQFLCTESVQPWGRPVQAFLKDTMKLVNAELHSALDTAFSMLKKRTVYREARAHLDALLKAHRETLTQQLGYALNLERRRMFTKNSSFFTTNKESELRELTRFRHFYRWASIMGQQAVQGERPKPYEKMTEEEKQQEQARMAKETPKMGRDPYQQELEVAAYVRGYYLTAASRFIDNVSLHILSGMLPLMADSITQHLDRKLGLMDQADKALFERLMEEEATTADKRAQLKEDKHKFEQAMESILALERTVSARTAQNDGDEDDEDDEDFDGDINMTPVSPLGHSMYAPTLATGEVM
ncbi:P-loop containing nucleoside triphosphate hydrolase protein [Coniochaeta sp. 2T2.1]|nr:P-loop containing nucleoside triphosphate hydrolase protein [Coniochaeta sp. 2T2.1]